MVRISNSKECKVWTPPLLLERCGLIDGTYWQQRILLLKAADCIGLLQISRGACWVPEILYHLADSASQNVRRAPPRGRSSLHLTDHAHTTFVNFISDRNILRHFRLDRNDAFSVTLSHSSYLNQLWWQIGPDLFFPISLISCIFPPSSCFKFTIHHSHWCWKIVVTCTRFICHLLVVKVHVIESSYFKRGGEQDLFFCVLTLMLATAAALKRVLGCRVVLIKDDVEINNFENYLKQTLDEMIISGC